MEYGNLYRYIRVARNYLILFADNVMLFCEASTEQIKVVMDTLEEFCSASGLRINTLKFKAMCFRMVHGERKREIQDISTIKFVADLGHYLGFVEDKILI